MENPKHIVRRGYDQLGSLYRTHHEQVNPHRYKDWLTTFARLLPKCTNMLELGYADGIPTARFLSQQFNYLGVDISPVQIEQARIIVPHARFEIADMTSLSFPSLSFDSVIALYSIIHLPLEEQPALIQTSHPVPYHTKISNLEEQPALIQTVYNWLRPKGYFLCIVGAEAWIGTDADWNQLGTSMYWSHSDAKTYQSWFIDIGFTIIDNQFVTEGTGGHTYFLLIK